MKIFYSDSFDKFIENCHLFYENKKVEQIRLFDVSLIDNKIYIGDEIKIPQKGYIIRPGGVSLNIKFFNWICMDISKKRRGILIIHNHDIN